ncbi:MAG: hypothetical protein J6D01_01885 [Muribaculaceae bacterium]|nr:hypothetical protein [Muribaculaceae bacterium]
MKTITFSLDKAKVLETVYALSAMRTYHRDAPQPLGRDEAPALMRLMEASAVNVMGELLRFIHDADVHGKDCISLTLNVPEGVTVSPAQQILMGVKLEEAVALGVLELAFDTVCPTVSADAGTSAVSAAREIAAVLDAMPDGLRLAPHPW